MSTNNRHLSPIDNSQTQDGLEKSNLPTKRENEPTEYGVTNRRKKKLKKGYKILIATIACLCLGACPPDPTSPKTSTDSTPPSITNHTFSVNENVASNTLVGHVWAWDNVEILFYRIAAGNSNEAFYLDPVNGELKTAGEMDYEAKSNYYLQVEVQDGEENASNAIITIHISNINEPPTFSTNTYVWTVAEDISNTQAIGTVSATDPDGDWFPLTFFILTNDDGLFEIEPGSGEISLPGRQFLDYETTNWHHITLAVSDGSLIGTATVTIQVTNVNDNAPLFDMPSYIFTNRRRHW